MAAAIQYKEKNFWQSRMQRGEALTAFIFLLPWIIGFLWFTAIPMGIALYVSITNYTIGAEPEIIGAANFVKIWKDQRLWHALSNTFIYAIISVPLYLIMSLLAALALNWNIFGIRVYRTIFYLPSITPAVASSILWLWIFNPQSGLANAILQFFGIETQAWLWDPSLTKPALIFMGLWGIGPTMIIFLAGLQGVPEQLYEAAVIDGAGAWAKFRHVTLPILSPVTFFNLILGIINAFQIFTTVYILTASAAGGASGERTSGIGGVLDSLLFYVLYLYEQAFSFWDFGYATAMGWLLLVIILIFTLIQFRWADRWVHYESE